MRCVVGMDIHRTFAEVVFWEDGRLRYHRRVDKTRSGLEGFRRSLNGTDEIVVEAVGDAMAVVRVLSPFIGRVIVANPMQVNAIAHTRIKTDKIDAGVLAQLHASGFLLEVSIPDERTERLRRLVARRNLVVRHRTWVKNEVHGVLQAHLVPKCLHTDLFNNRGRAWLERQEFPDDERATISARSTGWPRVWPVLIAILSAKRLLIRRSVGCRRSLASMQSRRLVSSPPLVTSGGSRSRRSR